MMIEEEKSPSATQTMNAKSETTKKPGMTTLTLNLTTAQRMELDQIMECDSQTESISVSEESEFMIETTVIDGDSR